MSLTAYQPRRFALVVDGQSLASLRGLTPTDIHALVNYHLADLQRLFDMVVSGVKLDETQTDTLLMGLLSEMPGLVANIIALAADEPTGAATVEQYPAAVQLEALQQIANMTFTEAMPIKKAVEVVVALLSRKSALKTAISKTLKKKTN